MATPKILIVEDEAVTRNTLKGIFEAEGYDVLQAQDGAEMYRQLNSETVNLIVLDINLPGKNGLLLGRELREKTPIPLIFLTGRDNEVDKILGLEIGADDYLTKPFHFQELEARIRSLTRRKFVQEDVCLKWNQLTFDTRTREASVNGVPLSLTRKESSLLEYFLLHQNRVISPEEMIEHIWDGSVNTFSNSIRVHISSLRKKLKAAIGFDPIQNKIGQGYILEEYR